MHKNHLYIIDKIESLDRNVITIKTQLSENDDKFRSLDSKLDKLFKMLSID